MNEYKPEPDVEALRTAVTSLRRQVKTLSRHLNNALDYIAQSEAHDGKLIAGKDLIAARQEWEARCSRIESGPLCGPIAAVDIHEARAAAVKGAAL